MKITHSYIANILFKPVGFTKISAFILTIAFLLADLLFQAQAATKNGFDLSNLSISETEVLAGGPPRDGIPSIDNPKFITIKDVDYLKDEDIVISLVRGNIARAYPTRILVWHEIVNEIIGTDPVVVTYCPLCGTAMVFKRKIAGKVLTFGVSGLLYRSDVLMYDRESESLWSQLGMKAVSGKALGQKLSWLASEHLTWKAWREKYPAGEVLSTDTGYHRNYGGQAYASYFASDRTMFPVPHTRNELPKKSWVIGVIVDGKAKAYPVNALKTNMPVADKIGTQDIIVNYDVNARHPQITNSRGEVIPSVMVFWFAWQAFYPATELYQLH